jgi:type IV pilus assembly protein PilA
VSAISVSGLGNIGITYSGSQANAKISGLKLGLVPLLDANNDVVWVCGSATVPTGVTSAVITAATTIPAAYLPNSCHA